MAFLTLAQMLASMPDGGGFTAAELRALVEDLVKSKIWAPYSIDHADDVWWQGNIGDFTETDPSGTTTWQENDGSLTCEFEDVAANDVAALTKARTFAVGDRWATRVRLKGAATNYLGAGVLFTDGTADTSNVIALVTYFGDGTTKTAYLHGTLTSISIVVVATSENTLDPFNDGQYLALEYSATDTFQARWSADGKRWTTMGVATQTKAMTPTRFGVGVVNFATSFPVIASFDPLCKVG